MLFRSQPRCSRLYRSVLIALLLAVMPLGIARAVQTDPNILFIFLDDLGIEHLESYGLQLGQDPIEYASTPYLTEKFVPNALLFKEAWTNPLCSPTRATIHTGLYGFRTGVGHIIMTDQTWGIDTDDDDLLPKLLGAEGYARGDFGKWHMGTSEGGASDAGDQGGDGAPIVAGYEVFQGMIVDKHPDFMTEPVFCDYTWTVCDKDQQGDPDCDDSTFDAGVECSSDTYNDDNYMTRRIFIETEEWIDDVETNAVDRPWFAYVALFAPHLPFHCPPEDLLSPNHPVCDDINGSPTELEMYHAMTNSVDVQIEWLLGELGLDPETDDWTANDGAETYVIIASDNGSPKEVIHEPVPDDKGKGTVFQGGVWVPLMIGGPDVDPGEVDDIVNLSDLYTTILELAGASNPHGTPEGNDSLDLTPYFDELYTGTVRTWAYVEHFTPNFDPTSDNGPTQAEQAIRNQDYKYGITSPANSKFFYNLANDPWEGTNIFAEGPPYEPEEEDAWEDLTDWFDVLTGGDILDLCATTRQNEESCTTGDDCCSGYCDLSNECADPM